MYKQIPNDLGALLSASQMILYLIYYCAQWRIQASIQAWTVKNERYCEGKIHIIISPILIKPRHKHKMGYVSLKFSIRK
jgi:hypothetical protein